MRRIDPTETGLQGPQRKTVKRSPVGASPGTLIADPNAVHSALSLTVISPEGSEMFTDVTLADVERACGEWPTIWLDCVGLANVDLIADIGRIFGLHPLALEDTVNTGQRAKIDFFEDHAFMVMSMIDDTPQHRYEQIAIYFSDRFVITFQERPGDPFGPVRKRIDSSVPNRLRTRKADYLAYALIDAVIDSYFPTVDDMAAKIDGIETEMIAAPRRTQVRRLHGLRRGVMTLKSALHPVRDALAALVRTEAPYVQPETRVFLNDTFDHSVSLIEIVETHRDMLTGLIDMHLSLAQARTSDVISFLTIVSSIFIPLTFLVGVWGMNFDPDSSPWNMPELRAEYGYPAALGFMLLVAVFLIGYFRWKKWL